MAFHIHLPAAQPPPTFTLTPSIFWDAVRERRDTDDFLPLLEGRNDLISHFAYFTSLNVTIDRLERVVTRTRGEMHHVFTEMITTGLAQRAAPFVQQRRNRPHPYRRPTRRYSGSSSSSSEYYSPPSFPSSVLSSNLSSPDPNDIPLPIPQSSRLQTTGTRLNPIRVDIEEPDNVEP
jgi:hypothetical protein